ncbi:porin family protein [Vibrio mimicus]|nr:outer membrane beta-barrel protein [Vibrio mimicus]QXC56115.1 porin family protein [Vibrio mimicus]
MKNKLLIVAISAVISSYANANSGYYLGLGTMAVKNSTPVLNDIPGHSAKDTGSGANIYTGYQFNTHFALEVDFSYSSISDSYITESHSALSSVDAYTLAIAPKFIQPLNKSLSIYAKPSLNYTILESDTYVRLEGASVSFDEKSKKTHAGLELGGTFALNENISLTLAYQRLFEPSKFEDLKYQDQLKFGLSYYL